VIAFNVRAPAGSAGLDWHGLVGAMLPAPDADWRADLNYCVQHVDLVNERERDFIRTLARWRREPTQKQLDWLVAIADRLRGAS
jgi:hypothetical protein